MKVKKKISLLVLFVGLLLIGGDNILAQENGILKGQIFDLTETGIPGAKITLGKNGQNYEIKTDQDGQYKLTLSAGTYLLIVRADGFLPSRKRQIKITAGQTTAINLTMYITAETIGCLLPLPKIKKE